MTTQERIKKENAIEIEPDGPDAEPELLIPEGAAEGTYHIEVYDNPLRVGHDKERARGRTLSDGVTHTVQNLRGLPLYARNLGTSTAYARVMKAGAEIHSEPSREVDIETGSVSIEGSELATESTLSTIEANTSGTQSVSLDTYNAGTLSVSNVDPVTVSNPVQPNEQGVATATATVDSTSASLPALSVPDGRELLLRTPEGNGDTVLIDDTFPLPPDSAISLSVTDASNISASSGTSGQTLYLIVEQ